MSKRVIVIPSRYGSTRLVGKPLKMIAGKTLLNRVWSIASSIENIDKVYIATDDSRIEEHAKSFGADVVMTPDTCRNGTERIFAAMNELKINPEVIINFQGDTPLVPPHILQALVNHMIENTSCTMATPAVKLGEEKILKCLEITRAGVAGGTYVTFDRNMKALYFSKSVIPFPRKGSEASTPVYKHLGIYAYRSSTLEKIVAYEPSQFEQAESLEQLRALENGIGIDVVKVDFKGRSAWSVDNPDDITEVERIIAAEGEILS